MQLKKYFRKLSRNRTFTKDGIETPNWMRGKTNEQANEQLRSRLSNPQDPLSRQ